MQLDFAASLLSEDKEKEKKARATVLHKLRPHALTGNDEQYAHLTSIYGTLFLDEQNYETAHAKFQEAFRYSPKHRFNLLRLLETHFRRGEFQDAFAISKGLAKAKFPNEQKALRMAIHCGLEAENYDDIRLYAERYTGKWPEDSTIIEVHRRLLLNEDLDGLKLLFSR